MRIPSDKFNHNKIHSTTRIANGSSLKICNIGKYNYISSGDLLFNVDMGNYCCLGSDVQIGSMQHSYWWYSMSPLLSDDCKLPEVTKIGNDVWIGAGCIMMGGITIGDGAVIGANSFVNKDVPPFTIVAGSPARIIRQRFPKETQEKILKTGYWNYSPTEAKKILGELHCIEKK